MAVVAFAVLMSVAVVAAFCGGCFLGLYASGKIDAARMAKTEQAEETDSGRLTVEKQLENMMRYDGGDSL